MIFWFTGQAGSGKTTLANGLKKELKSRGYKVFHLDGDELREASQNKDYSKEGRMKNVGLAQWLMQKAHDEGCMAIASFMSPCRSLRESFKKDKPYVVEIYTHTTSIRGREQFFAPNYEPPLLRFIDVDTTDVPVETCLQKIIDESGLPDCFHHVETRDGKKGDWALFIGRWQPWHSGHQWLVEQALNKGKKVLVGIRCMPVSESNPFSNNQVYETISSRLSREIEAGQVQVMLLPNIGSVEFGRGVGYDIIEHYPSLLTKKISATEERKRLTISQPCVNFEI